MSITQLILSLYHLLSYSSPDLTLRSVAERFQELAGEGLGSVLGEKERF